VTVDARTTQNAPVPAPTAPVTVAEPPGRRLFSLTPLNRRRLDNFKRNRRGYWAFWIFLFLFFVSLFAEFIANDKPFLIYMEGKPYFPAIIKYPETAFGGEFETAADYRDPYLQNLIAKKGGTIIWPIVRYSYDTHNLPRAADTPVPNWFDGWRTSGRPR
jgi:microcin C transport system permease protein